MSTDVTGTLDEAYERLHATGPEFDGFLSNHGPMAAEAMVRHGHAGTVHHWLDGYMRRLEEFPRGTAAIGEDWRAALGDPRRVADWTAYFRREVSGQPWRNVLGTWWPRLLPGVAAAATHGVIRVGHAVRALLEDGDDTAHVAELAHGLAYWAARWQPVPGAGTGLGRPAAGGASVQPAADALAKIPRIADQTGGVGDRLGRLADLPGWPAALAAPGIPASAAEISSALAGLADAAVIRYLSYGHGNGIMLVHSATAPGAVLRTLPALDTELWAPSLAASWAAAAALTAVYAPAAPAARADLPRPPAGTNAAEDTFARAVDHGDEHVIKFADTAADAYARTGNPDALAAAVRAADLIGR
jgi:Questin oxidase-like